MWFQASLGAAPATRAVRVIVRPMGGRCNLACSYCRCGDRGAGARGVMDEAVVRRLVREQAAAGPDGLEWVWSGGEPLLAGLAFFQQVEQLQRTVADGAPARNTVCTNATLLTDEVAAWLARVGWRVVVGVDGPGKLHDACRNDLGGGGSFRRASRGLELLRRHGVSFATQTMVSRHTVQRPAEIYAWLRDNGSRRLEFRPLLECEARKGGDPLVGAAREEGLTVESVRAARYGEFLCTLFDAWWADGERRVAVGWAGALGWSETDGETVDDLAPGVVRPTLVVEPDGAVYPDVRHIRPEVRVGELAPAAPGVLVQWARAALAAPGAALPEACRACEWRAECGGGAPRHRFATAGTGEGASYLCPAYRRFFQHRARVRQEMAAAAATESEGGTGAQRATPRKAAGGAKPTAAQGRAQPARGAVKGRVRR